MNYKAKKSSWSFKTDKLLKKAKEKLTKESSKVAKKNVWSLRRQQKGKQKMKERFWKEFVNIFCWLEKNMQIGAKYRIPK